MWNPNGFNSSMGQASNVQVKFSDMFLTVAGKDVWGIVFLSTEGCSTHSDKEGNWMEGALLNQQSPHLFCRCWWSGGILMRMRTWDREKETQMSPLLCILKAECLIFKPTVFKNLIYSVQLASRSKAQDLPWGMSSTVASENHMPPVCSDVVSSLCRARPTARLPADPVIWTQYLQWTSNMVHLVTSRTPV